jgi:hypothetical protein
VPIHERRGYVQDAGQRCGVNEAAGRAMVVLAQQVGHQLRGSLGDALVARVG